MKNKKTIIALVAVAFITIIGLTFAYFSDTVILPNSFKTKPYSTTVTEVFESPDNWTPGTTTAKTVYATNNGDIDVAVRVSYTEKWEPLDSEATLGLTQTQEIDGVETQVRAAIINFADDYATEWTKSTENGVDYYYYNHKLAKGNTSSSFIKSVQFNPLIKSSADCVDSDVVNDSNEVIGTKTTCESSNTGYDGATYTLTIKVETIQFDAYKDAWGTNVVIE
ncbi:MAG: hypothetical protein IJR82_01140 [Bacilli bacterium]|nr:hypothetical protein [Bacilli bacterium]